MIHVDPADEFATSPTPLLDAVRRVDLAIRAQTRRALADLDLLPAHYTVLVAIGTRPGLSQAELARHLGVTQQNMTRMAARLTDRDLIDRVPDRVDDDHPATAPQRVGHHVGRRGVGIRLSRRGREVLRQTALRISAIETAVGQSLTRQGPDDLRASLDEVLENLHRINDRHDRARQAASRPDRSTSRTAR